MNHKFTVHNKSDNRLISNENCGQSLEACTQDNKLWNQVYLSFCEALPLYAPHNFIGNNFQTQLIELYVVKVEDHHMVRLG